ncbi:hypothetical protein ACO0LO_07955 [Undibacterium sp. TJN25]|uniref:hypothetical protein n=1 Tax=Undibacterium sp. TJN25 TaxID=3413056 RepID=UPI003BF3168F
MPLAPNRISRDRANYAGTLSAADIASLLEDRELRILQTGTQPDLLTCRRLNESLFAQRPELEFRVYDGGPAVCDLSFLKYMDNVRHFSADCLERAAGIQHLASLRDLHTLAIGIGNLPDFSFLDLLPAGQLHTLYLGKTVAAPVGRQPSLEPLCRQQGLHTLYLEGQKNGIEQIAGLPQLHDLTLRSVALPQLDFLHGMAQLRLLDIKQCRIRDWSALGSMSRLQFLELWQIRGLADLSFMSSMTGLQNLFLQALPQVQALPDVSRLRSLRRIYLEALPKLRDIHPLEQAPALQEFIHIAGRHWQAGDYEGLLQLPALKKACVEFSSEKKSRAFQDLLQRHGVQHYHYTEFEFEEQA